MSLSSCREPDVAAMEAELAALEAPEFRYLMHHEKPQWL